MKSRGSSFLGTLPFLVLLGCATPPHPENPAPSSRENAAINEINAVLKADPDRTDAYEYVVSDNSTCRGTLTIKWPEGRRAQEKYSEATTVLEFDWRRIASASYQKAPGAHPADDAGTADSSISIGFFFPQPYRTKARTRDGAQYDAMGFFDGVDLSIAGHDPAGANKAVSAILGRKEACPEKRADIAIDDTASYSPEEQYQLGDAYLFSRHPGPKPALAYQWYEQAARRGNLKAQLRMGNARRSGLHGVPKEMIEARRWFESAAAQGSPHAADMLGDMYEKGVGGVAPDLAKAAAFYRSAADQGLVTAQEALADMLRFGKGIPKDVAEARIWYRKAEAAGSSSARDALVAMDKE